VPFVPSIGKSPAATGTAIVMIISKRIIKRMGVNPFFGVVIENER
jgi:hypothetical protein